MTQAMNRLNFLINNNILKAHLAEAVFKKRHPMPRKSEQKLPELRIEPTFETRGREFIVGAKAIDSNYCGPHAEVSWLDQWLIIDCGEEQSAMLNIEALPALMKALRKIQKQIKEKQKDAA